MRESGPRVAQPPKRNDSDRGKSRQIRIGLGIAAASVFTIGLAVALYLMERRDHIDLRVRQLSF